MFVDAGTTLGKTSDLSGFLVRGARIDRLRSPEKVEKVKQSESRSRNTNVSSFALPLPAAPRAERRLGALTLISPPRAIGESLRLRILPVPTMVRYDDPFSRRRGFSALGRYNGAVDAVDPNTGRILTSESKKSRLGRLHSLFHDQADHRNCRP